MDGPDDVRARYVQHLVTALVAAEILRCRLAGLQHRAHRPVRDDHPVSESGPQSARPFGSLKYRERAHGPPQVSAFIGRTQNIRLKNCACHRKRTEGTWRRTL